MKLRDLLEEFKTGIKVYGKYFEVYVNPSKKEIEKITKKTDGLVRFIVDYKNKKIYMFDFKVLHHKVAKELGISYRDENFYFGSGDVEHGKIVDWDPSPMTPSDELKKKAWLKKYIGM